MEQVPSWELRPPLVQAGPGTGLVNARGARMISQLIDLALVSAARDGVRPPELVAMKAVADAIAAGGGHADVRRAPDPPRLPHDDAIDSTEAARLLRRDARTVRRLAEAGVLGPVVKRGRRWVLSRSHVSFYVAARPMVSERTSA